MIHRTAIKLMLGFAVCLATSFSIAQEAKPQPAPPTTASSVWAARNSTEVYKLDYVFSEVQNGKRVNSRSYSTLLHSGERGSIRLGSRMPILVSQASGTPGTLQYMDIGVNIDCRVEHDVESGVALFTSVDMSSIAPEQPGENRTGAPIVRQTKLQVDNIVPLDKRTLIGSADQVDGNGRFDFEVTATKVR
jgi:hypothetical protein